MSPQASPTRSAPATDTEVAAVFASYPEDVRAGLFDLRALIFATAEETHGVGPIEEALRWGQPSYLTSRSRSGSTIRLAMTPPGSDHDFGMYFICRTNLVRRFEQIFGDAFAFEANRALLFRVGDALKLDELRACAEMALTYHRSAR